MFDGLAFQKQIAEKIGWCNIFKKKKIHQSHNHLPSYLINHGRR